jgi:allophanate hydrolase
VVPAVRSIDCVSVFASEVDLAWRVACAAGGHDPDDPMSRSVPPTSRGVARTAGVLAISTLHELGVAAHIAAGYTQACDALAEAGVALQEIDLRALLEVGSLLYGGPWVAERFASVGAFVQDVVALDGGVGLDPVVRSIIEASARWTAVDAQRAGYRLAALRAEIDAMFDTVDVLVTPTIAHEATLAEVAAEPLEANARLGCFTTFSNLADLCALALPVPGTSIPGLPPVSVSLHGPAWSDEMLVHTAALVQPAIDDVPAAARVPRGWITIAVAGAHLRGQPLEHQLTERRAVWLGTTASADSYRLYALPNTVPPKPGLVRVGAGHGTSIELDVWALPPDGFGTFVASIPAPLCIGTVELADGATTSGFLCEPGALEGATDITSFGGWRAYRAGT